MSEPAVSIGKWRHAWHVAATTLALSMVLIWAVFLTLRAGDGVEQQRQVAFLQARVAQLERDFGAHRAADDARDQAQTILMLSEVARAVAQPNPDHRAAADRWLLTRDKDVRDRLERLERWRLVTERRE